MRFSFANVMRSLPRYRKRDWVAPRMGLALMAALLIALASPTGHNVAAQASTVPNSGNTEPLDDDRV